MGKDPDEVEAGAELICPHCDSPIEKIQIVQRELTTRGWLGLPAFVAALACPTCRRLLGFHHV
ncbi:hypothetical protein TA3x_003378 [Tundrisphaera sp. TA3]|uniref:hypothetical protein n=1 Tax=Tundrisphaera sp. TA3 TaxID=3435775 RepID=UPI003EB9FA4A